MKTLIRLLLLCLFTFPHGLKAQGTDPVLLEEATAASPLSSANMKKQLDVTEGGKEEDTQITFRSEETGLEQKYDLADDKSRLSIGYHVNSNLRKLTQVNALDFNYGFNFKEYLWAEFFVTTATIEFDTLSQVNLNRSVDYTAWRSTSENLLIGGAGLGTKTTFIRDFLNFDKLYESMTAYLGYLRLDERFLDENYAGFGIRADYGIHYRASETYHIGLKGSYHLFSVKRSEAFTDEPQPRRHLALSWLSLGGEIAFYF